MVDLSPTMQHSHSCWKSRVLCDKCWYVNTWSLSRPRYRCWLDSHSLACVWTLILPVHAIRSSHARVMLYKYGVSFQSKWVSYLTRPSIHARERDRNKRTRTRWFWNAPNDATRSSNWRVNQRHRETLTLIASGQSITTDAKSLSWRNGAPVLTSVLRPNRGELTLSGREPLDPANAYLTRFGPKCVHLNTFTNEPEPWTVYSAGRPYSPHCWNASINSFTRRRSQTNANGREARHAPVALILSTTSWRDNCFTNHNNHSRIISLKSRIK